MNRNSNDITAQKIEQLKPLKINDKFTEQTINFCVLACHTNSNLENTMSEVIEGLGSLAPQNGLQEMLAAQMLSIHKLQQTSIAMMNLAKQDKTKQYFTNTAIKLSNTFIQQAALFNKLKGHGEDKIIVGRVDVHSGGQAVVGNITGSFSRDQDKK